MDEIQKDIDSSVRKSKEIVTKLEKDVMDARSEISKLDFELNGKREELNRTVVDGDRRAAEITQYSGARNALQIAEREFEDVKKTHDDFMDAYPAKSNDQKRILKV